MLMDVENGGCSQSAINFGDWEQLGGSWVETIGETGDDAFGNDPWVDLEEEAEKVVWY